MENLKNKVIEIEDYNGNTIMAFNIDKNGNIRNFYNCNVADVDNDFIFNTKKNSIRIQQEI